MKAYSWFPIEAKRQILTRKLFFLNSKN